MADGPKRRGRANRADEAGVPGSSKSRPTRVSFRVCPGPTLSQEVPSSKLEFSDDGSLTYSSEGNIFRAINTHTGRIKTTFTNPHPILSFSCRGNIVITADGQGGITHWDLNNPAAAPVHVMMEESNVVSAVDFSSTSNMFASTGRDGKVRVYDSMTLQRVVTMHPSSTPGPDSPLPMFVRWNHGPGEDHMLVSATTSNAVDVWDARRVHPVRQLEGLQLPANCSQSVDACGPLVAVAGVGDTDRLQLFDFVQGTTKSLPWDQPVIVARFVRHDPQVLVAGGLSNDVKIYDTIHSKEACQVTGVNGVSTLAARADQIAMGCRDNNLRIRPLVRDTGAKIEKVSSTTSKGNSKKRGSAGPNAPRE